MNKAQEGLVCSQIMPRKPLNGV